VVDLGKSSQFSHGAWSGQYGCPVLSADSFRRGVADARVVREILSAGLGCLIDEEGIDWWDLISLLLVPEVLNLLAFERLTAQIDTAAEIWTTRPGWPASAMAILLGKSLRSFTAGRLASAAAGAGHYAALARRFSVAQIKEIFWDKYDSGYQWRSRLASPPERCGSSVVLLPSAYENVSRMAADYARLLPERPFLLVATRESAKRFTAPANVEVRDLAAYARPSSSTGETLSLIERWTKLRPKLHSSPQLHVLLQTGALDAMPEWLRNGIFARNAWREVIEREPLCSVLCGDDSNRFTRLPVLLAAARKIPTADFHHGALDGRYLFKDLPCDVYLAKNVMEHDYLLRVCGLPGEKIVLAPPAAPRVSSSRRDIEQRSVVLFSEPYEAGGIRAEEFYREVLPPLLNMARENGRGLTIKLHPFESRPQRARLVREILGEDDAARVTIVDGPLTNGLISQAWCGVTIESTTAIDCRQSGVCCFLCGWLSLAPYEYAQQYARFGIGSVLHSVEDVREIPARLAAFSTHPVSPEALDTPADPAALQRWLKVGDCEPVGARHAS